MPLRQKIGLQFVNPFYLPCVLTFGTMPVTAGIVSRFFIAALFTFVDMPAQCGTSAIYDIFKCILLNGTEFVVF